jgi:hypothetical protein
MRRGFLVLAAALMAVPAWAQTSPPAVSAPMPVPAAPGPGAAPGATDEPPPPTASQPRMGGSDLSFDTALLQGLDKVTARVLNLEAPVGAPVHFGTLEIIVRACKKRRPEDQPESAAFLDIWELHKDMPAQALFRGWMFASSPALSAMEHPVYDIWVLDCIGKRR